MAVSAGEVLSGGHIQWAAGCHLSPGHPSSREYRQQQDTDKWVEEGWATRGILTMRLFQSGAAL